MRFPTAHRECGRRNGHSLLQYAGSKFSTDRSMSNWSRGITSPILPNIQSKIQRPAVAATRLPYMRLTPFEQALPNKRFTQQQFDVLFRPILGGQSLQEHHDFLEVHALEFIGPFDEERGANVEVEG